MDAAFELVELDFVNGKVIVAGGVPADSITHTLETGDTITRAATGATPEASELVNYANWFAYYRTRMLAAKTVTSLAFSELTDKFRVGFHTLSNVPATDFLTVDDFTGGAGNQRSKWFGRLQNVKVPMGNDTPLLDAVARIGEWFASSTGTHPELTGSTDPINLSCQKNYHIMFTDGYTNQNAMPTVTVGNTDGSVIPPTSRRHHAGTDPRPRSGHRLAEQDQGRTDRRSRTRCRTTRSSTGTPTCVRRRSTSSSPRTTSRRPRTTRRSGSTSTSPRCPSAPRACSRRATRPRPRPRSRRARSTGRTPTPTVNRPGVTGVDDLWHAAIAGRSQFVNARDPQELQTGMASILNEIKNLQAARAGVAFSSVNFTAADNYVYRVTIEPGWGGTLTKVEIDPKGDRRSRHQHQVPRGPRGAGHAGRRQSAALVRQAQRHHLEPDGEEGGAVPLRRHRRGAGRDARCRTRPRRRRSSTTCAATAATRARRSRTSASARRSSATS